MILVLGAGLQGRAVCQGLHIIYGPDIEVLDHNEDNIRLVGKDIKKTLVHFQPSCDSIKGIIKERKPDVVINCLPYVYNLAIANYCMENSTRYCDLGGNRAQSAMINSRALVKAKKPIMTDLGLAPGLVNILGQNLARKVYGCYKLIMSCGGLPVKPLGQLAYARTFSMDGLVNEYLDKSVIIRNYRQQEVYPLEEKFDVYIDGKALESFVTSGGLHTTSVWAIRNELKDCAYRTIRYPGHYNILKFLYEDLEYDDHDIKEILQKCCPETKEDCVLIKIEYFWGYYAGCQDYKIKHDEFTAMQKCTGFPTAVVANMLAEGRFDDKQVVLYEDVPYEEFMLDLGILLPEIL